MMRQFQIAALLLGLWPIVNVGAQRGGGFKLSDDNAFNNASTGLTYHLTNFQEIDLRQDISVHGSGDTHSRWKGATRGNYDVHYNDVNFGSGKLRPYVGADAAYVYGSQVNDTLIASSEAGVKIRLHPRTSISVQAEYQSLYHDGDQIDDAFNDGSMVYSLGIGIRF